VDKFRDLPRSVPLGVRIRFDLRSLYLVRAVHMDKHIKRTTAEVLAHLAIKALVVIRRKNDSFQK
jgi:hypothetical protein